MSFARSSEDRTCIFLSPTGFLCHEGSLVENSKLFPFAIGSDFVHVRIVVLTHTHTLPVFCQMFHDLRKAHPKRQLGANDAVLPPARVQPYMLKLGFLNASILILVYFTLT